MMKRYTLSFVMLTLCAVASAADQPEAFQKTSSESREAIKAKLLDVFKEIKDPIIKDDYIDQNPNKKFGTGAYLSPCGLVFVCLVMHNLRPYDPWGHGAECTWKQFDLYCHYAHYDNGVVKKGRSQAPVMSANTSRGATSMAEYGNKGFGYIAMGNISIVGGQALYGPIFDLKQESEEKNFSFVHRPTQQNKKGTCFIYYLDGNEEKVSVEDTEKYLASH